MRIDSISNSYRQQPNQGFVFETCCRNTLLEALVGSTLENPPVTNPAKPVGKPASNNGHWNSTGSHWRSHLHHTMDKNTLLVQPPKAVIRKGASYDSLSGLSRANTLQEEHNPSCNVVFPTTQTSSSRRCDARTRAMMMCDNGTNRKGGGITFRRRNGKSALTLSSVFCKGDEERPSIKLNLFFTNKTV